MRNRLIKTLLVAAMMSFAGTQMGLAVNITIYDGVGSGSGWYGSQEVGEVEPPANTGLAWDLQSFDLSGNTLTLTGGWNFQGGFSGNASGDIFIDVDGNAVYGQDVYTGTVNGNLPQPNVYNYDYVIHFNRTGTAIGSAYDVYQLDGQATLLTASFRVLDGSSPWIYARGGTQLTDASGNAVFGTLPGDLFTMAVDVGFLGTDFTGDLFKFTMQCGNDNLVGRVPGVPDGGLTAALLGLALVGLGAIKRRLQK